MRLGLALSLSVLAACAASPPGGGSAGGGGSGGGGGSTGTGGGTQGTAGGAVVAGDYPCDVGAIVQSSCIECHQNPPLFGAPMPLVTWADTQAESAQFPGQKIHQRMAARVSATVRPMPQAPRTLTAEQIAAITAWSSAGAPKNAAGMCGAGGGSGGSGGSGGGSAAGGAEPPGCPAGSTKIDVLAPSFSIPQASDFYQCFSQKLTLPGKRQVIKIDKQIDDARVLHHVVLFRDQAKTSPAQIADCGVKATWQALYAWGPGAGPMVPPADVGIPVNDGDQLVLQIHYNNATHVSGNDSSGAYLCVTDQMRTNEASVLAIGPTSFSLPPNCPATSVQASCNNVLNTTFNVFTVWPHMHLRGRAMKTTLVRSGAADQIVTDRPMYDFGSQYLETANFQFKPGDRLVNRCTWDTMGATGPVSWGEETSREMCFNFLYLYPVPPLGLSFCPPQSTSQPSCP